MVGGSVFLADRALAAPDLGAPPAGPSHGANEDAIAVALGEEMAAQLIEGPHGVVVLSEQDLTVLAVANNPHPSELKELQVRVRDGLVVVSARVSAGPFTPTAVAHISLSLRPGAEGPVIAAQVPEVDIGMLGLPGFAGSSLVVADRRGPVARPSVRDRTQAQRPARRHRVRRRPAGWSGGRGARSRRALARVVVRLI